MRLDGYKKISHRGTETRRQRVICLAILLFFLVATVPFLPACKKEAVERDEGTIKDVIVRYDKALMKVYMDLDVGPLAGLASKKEIGKNYSLVMGYQTRKRYMESELKEIRFEGFKNKGKGEVDVRVREKWRWRDMEIKTGKEVKPWKEEEYRLVYHMKKGKDKKWVVDSLEFEK